MQNQAQMKESKCSKDILKCANEKRRITMNNKGPAKPVHLHSLISTFVTHSLESRVAKLTTDKISIYLLISELPRTISSGKDRLLSDSYLSYYWPTHKNLVLMAYTQKPPLIHLSRMELPTVISWNSPFLF